jgi:hypothetical protein
MKLDELLDPSLQMADLVLQARPLLVMPTHLVHDRRLLRLHSDESPTGQAVSRAVNPSHAQRLPRHG